MITLIDGHNLIAKMPDIRLDEADDEEKLITKLRQYRARTNRRVIVFFDAGAVFRVAEQRSRGGLMVRFAPHGVSADMLIIKHLTSAKRPGQLMVVTSDRDIQRVAEDVRARVVSSTEFAALLASITDYVPESKDLDADDMPIISDAEVNEWLAIFNNASDGG